VEGKRVAWVGDGNNMANAWSRPHVCFELRLACPEGSSPTARSSKREAKRLCDVTEVPEEAVEGRTWNTRVGLDGQ